MKRLLVVLLVLAAVTRGDRAPSRIYLLKGILAPYAERMGAVLVRDAKGCHIRFRVTTPDR